MVENYFAKKYRGSLEPPLGSSTKKLDHQISRETSISSWNATNQVAEPTSESSVINFVEEPSNELVVSADGSTVDAVVADVQENNDYQPDVMGNSSVTLVSTNEDNEVLPPDIKNQSDSPLKKSTKRRFESGTTSIPGIVNTRCFRVRDNCSV